MMERETGKGREREMKGKEKITWGRLGKKQGRGGAARKGGGGRLKMGKKCRVGRWNVGKKTRKEEVEEYVEVGGGRRQQVEEWVEGICAKLKKGKKRNKGKKTQVEEYVKVGEGRRQ